ncbi:MAG: hypothetical protein KDA55_20925, partial [Planctomycetales bacterium]|nr:hypothetical protein [Planctomycetales bacterium]
MNDRQEDRFSMFLVVRGFLDQNSATVSSIPAFLAAQNDFGTQVDAIQSLSQQLLSSAGTTADKTQLRGAMADAAVPIAAAMRALAAVTGDNQLAAQADVTRITLIGGRDTVAADRADQLHAVATQQAANLVDYGISDSHLTTLRAAIDAYRAAVQAPQQTIAANAAVRVQINDAFSAPNKTLN